MVVCLRISSQPTLLPLSSHPPISRTDVKNVGRQTGNCACARDREELWNLDVPAIYFLQSILETTRHYHLLHFIFSSFILPALLPTPLQTWRLSLPLMCGSVVRSARGGQLAPSRLSSSHLAGPTCAMVHGAQLIFWVWNNLPQPYQRMHGLLRLWHSSAWEALFSSPHAEVSCAHPMLKQNSVFVLWVRAYVCVCVCVRVRYCCMY